MTQSTLAFRKQLGKAKVTSVVNNDISKDGELKRIKVSQNILSVDADFDSGTNHYDLDLGIDVQCDKTGKKRSRKSAAEKYREHYLSRINRYVEIADSAYRKGLIPKGLKYHSTLTVDSSNEDLARLPAKLSKCVKGVLDKSGIVGIGVIEKGDGNAGAFGRLHAHVLSNKRIKQGNWPYGYVKTKRVKNKSSVLNYMKKSFYRSEESSAYYAPRERIFKPMTDREFFSVVWGKKRVEQRLGAGGTEVKLLVSKSLKELGKRMDPIADSDKDGLSRSQSQSQSTVTISVYSSLDDKFSTPSYSKSFLVRASLFSSTFQKLLDELHLKLKDSDGKLDDFVLHMANSSFEDFSKRVVISHKGTCGYSFHLDTTSKNSEHSQWNLNKYIDNSTRPEWVTIETVNHLRKYFRRFQEDVNARFTDDHK